MNPTTGSTPERAPSRPSRASRGPWLAMALVASVTAACAGPQSTLDPAGPAASSIAELYWILAAISAVIFILVCGLLVYALLHRHAARAELPPLPLAPGAREEQNGQADEEPDSVGTGRVPLPIILDTADTDRRSIRWIVAGGVLMPIVVLTAAMVFTLDALGALYAEDDARPDLTIEVTGWQWWWEVHYFGPGGDLLFETANEIHIPVGQRVEVRLEAGDVIHSFWVPRLAGKLDMIPGRSNQFWIQADEPGVYRGQCAEYCDGPHALMALLVVAQPENEFRAWLVQQRQPARPATTGQGPEAFGIYCAMCHTVRGTPADGEIGPDLTHVASRLTLAAVTLPNTRGHMGGWIANPQQIKPGNEMPAMPLSTEEFNAVLRYVQSLR